MPGDTDHVLDCNRHAAQRQVHVDGFRLSAGVLQIGRKVAPERRIDGGDAVREGVERLAWGELAGAQALLQTSGGFEDEVVAHSFIRAPW